MSDIRFNRWLHQSGTGGVFQDSAGNVGIGSSVPTATLDINGILRVGSGVTISGVSTSTFSDVRFQGNVVSSIKQSSVPFIEQTNTISQDYTIGTNFNALTVGDVTINNGITVTIPNGSSWVVI